MTAWNIYTLHIYIITVKRETVLNYGILHVPDKNLNKRNEYNGKCFESFAVMLFLVMRLVNNYNVFFY